jgi:hypothetical protein
MKIRLVGAELFHVGGQTDRHGVDNSRFSQFCERAQNSRVFVKSVSRDAVLLLSMSGLLEIH